MSATSVLVVDADVDSRVICRLVLTRHGYRVVEAADGVSALELARAKRPCAVVMELTLPVMDGWAVLDRLRLDPATAGVPVIVLSVHASSKHRDQAAQRGCSAYLVKPCSPRLILEEVRRHAPPVAPEPPPQAYEAPTFRAPT